MPVGFGNDPHGVLGRAARQQEKGGQQEEAGRGGILAVHMGLLPFFEAECAIVGFADVKPCVAGGGLGEVILGAHNHHVQHLAVVKRVPGVGDDRFPHFFLRFERIGGKQQNLWFGTAVIFGF